MDRESAELFEFYDTLKVQEGFAEGPAIGGTIFRVNSHNLRPNVADTSQVCCGFCPSRPDVLRNVSACALACHSDEDVPLGHGNAEFVSVNGTAHVMCTAPSLEISTAAPSGSYRVFLTLNRQKEALFSEGEDLHFMLYKSLGCAGGMFAPTYREECHPCAPGTAESRILDTGTGSSSNYSDMEHTQCRACQLGQYQPLPGAFSCISCPIGENEPVEVRATIM